MNTSLTTEHTVAITRCGDRALVVPGHVLIGPEEPVTFQALSVDFVVLLFPTLLLVDERGEEAGRVELHGDPDTQELPAQVTLNVKPDARPGVHPYVVYDAEACDFALGGSHPKMIVKR